MSAVAGGGQEDGEEDAERTHERRYWPARSQRVKRGGSEGVASRMELDTRPRSLGRSDASGRAQSARPDAPKVLLLQGMEVVRDPASGLVRAPSDAIEGV